MQAQQKRTHLSSGSSDGQSLIEIMIALAIGSLLIGAASFGITFILRSSTANQKLQSASGLTGDLVERVRSVSSADWQNVYGLTKGTSTAYFVNASGTTLFFLEGKEGVLGDDISSGLVGHWKFDEATSTTATSTYDASGNNNHGTLMSGVLRATSTCRVSHCLSFDGVNDAVSISGSSASLQDLTDNGNSFSFAGWFKPSGLPQNTYDGYLFLRVGYHLGPFYRKTDGELRAVIWYNDLTNTIITTGKILETGTWYYVAMTVDELANEFKLYLNGVQVGSTASITKALREYGTAVYKIGGNTTYSSYGLIDDVRIYNRTLSADEINRLYGSTVFTRYFNVEDVSRDSSGDIVTSGGNDDPSTQKITTYVEWPGVGSAVGQVKIIDYITRWSNRIFSQTDWSGGSGEEGPVTYPGSKYSSSTGVSNPVGFIKIEGL